MAEQMQVKLPKHLPALRDVATEHHKLFYRPLPMLMGLSLKDLFKNNDITNVWQVGSRAWRHALGMPVPEDKDIDLIFSGPGEALDFLGNAYHTLSMMTDESMWSLSNNDKFYSGHKLRNAMTGGGIIDAWELSQDESIAECIAGFKNQHERVAIAIGASAGDGAAVTRLVKPRSWQEKKKTEPVVLYGS